MLLTGRRRSFHTFGMIFAYTLVAIPLSPAGAQAVAPALPVEQTAGNQALSYTDLADLALSSQLIAGVTITKAERLTGDLARGVSAENARFLIEATTGMLLRGADGMPGTVNYLVDVRLDAKGKAPKLKKMRVILIADRVSGRPQEVRLTSPYSQLDWTQSTESQLRAILTEATSANPPPPITGIGNAFHVPGAIPGESESQIFLTTRDNLPISLSILRRPQEQPQWAVALGEMVDDSARAPARNTLLWYRLACFLPPRLPGRSVAQLSESDAAAVREDYRYVLSQLGDCGRTIKR